MFKHLIRAMIGLVAFAGLLLPGVAHVTQSLGPTPTKSPLVLFREDFSTRANRWQLADLGTKSAIAYTSDGLLLRASVPHYALWSVPDNALKLQRFDIQTEAHFSVGDATARVGLIIDYRTASDLQVLAVARDGTVYFGHYLFGIWKDILAPTHISLDAGQAGQTIALEARVQADHTLRFTVNGQTAIQTTIADFNAGGFGLFALTGKTDGVQVVFSRYMVDDIS